MEYDTVLYRTRRQAGEVIFEYDRQEIQDILDSILDFTFIVMRKSRGIGGTGVRRRLAQGGRTSSTVVLDV